MNNGWKLCSHGPDKVVSFCKCKGYGSYLLIAYSLLLSACNPADNSYHTTNKSHAQLTPPGIERLSRAIDTSTLEVDFQYTIDDGNPTPVLTEPEGSKDGVWNATFTVPKDSVFAVQIVWSAVGNDDIRLRYARFINSYGAITGPATFSVDLDKYEMAPASNQSLA